jgi:ribulose-phosphate 3-epimerase
MPSTLAFDMGSDATYRLFASGGISMIHCDIMDGFYVNNVAGSIEQLAYIRSKTTAKLHVHLMTESPENWATAAISAGADIVILSTGTSGVRNAIKKIKAAGKKVGLALHPHVGVEVIKPVLRELDEVLVMSVIPGAGGQEFMESAVQRISILNNTRKKYGLNFKISVDGGINSDTAQKAWAAGADYLVAGNYLAKAADFPLAVQSLLP